MRDLTKVISIKDVIDLGEERERRRKKAPQKACCEMCDRPLSKREERNGICNVCFEEIMGR